MRSRQAFFQKVSASLIVPITFLPLAAILLALGDQLHIDPVKAAGMAVLRSWLPLFYGIGISVGFTDGDGMGALSVATGFLVMIEVAEAVSGDPTLNVGVLGGVVAGALCTWLYNRVKHVSLPEYLALFSGKRIGPMVGALAGVGLGYGFGLFWPPIHAGIVALGHWIYSAGALGVFVYGAVLRLLIPTGLHHILMQLVDTHMGGWIDPSGKLVAGEYLRFLAGDPQAGRILSGFFLTLGFGPLGAAMAIAREARPEQRRKVAGMMTTAALTAMLLGVTEPVEFAYIFASPVLYGLHVVFSGLASVITYALDIRLGGYALPMMLINWHRQHNGLLLLPLGLAYTALYYFSFRAVIRWLRPPVLGQVAEDGAEAAATADDEGAAFLAALGGEGNITGLDACMTRLRLVVQDPSRLDDARLRQLGAAAVIRPGGGDVQVVVGARAGEVAGRIRSAMGASPSMPATPAVAAEAPHASGGEVLLLSPLSGHVVPLENVPDPVFAGRIAGDGVAVEATAGEVRSPVAGRVAHVFPGGHALGIVTPEGLEVLIHVGIDTVKLGGEGFAVQVTAGDTVEPGTLLGRFDPALIASRGKSLVSPVLITNPDRVEQLSILADEDVTAGQPLVRVRLHP